MQCVPPKTRSLRREEYESLLKDTDEDMEGLISKPNLTIMRDFNCKEVCWEKWMSGRL